ncbi:hypothetical protein OAC63_02270 [Amylibacter sp.]|jgi:hypothetical protein|nr:hypothetical protein [Amylibacter sp.]MDB9857200.1 hypothetical protein [Amylibacter sp.]
MVFKGNLDIDPRGLIYEAYRMDIGDQECRSIFLDWALGTQLGADMRAMLETLLAEYEVEGVHHAMTDVLREGLQKANRPAVRRGGRARTAGE